MEDELKKQMAKFKHINWSEIVRQAIIHTLEKQENRNIAKAVLLNERSIITPDKGYKSGEAIREWRAKVRWKQ